MTDYRSSSGPLFALGEVRLQRAARNEVAPHASGSRTMRRAVPRSVERGRSSRCGKRRSLKQIDGDHTGSPATPVSRAKQGVPRVNKTKPAREAARRHEQENPCSGQPTRSRDDACGLSR